MEANPCERELVAAALLMPETADEIARLIAVAALGDSRNRIILRAVFDLRAQGYEPTGEELNDYLDVCHKLEAAGGWSYIAGLDVELPNFKRLAETADGMRKRVDSDGAHAYCCHVCDRPASAWSEPLAIAGHHHPARWPACEEHRSE